MSVPRLMGTAEVAERLGVGQSRATQIVRRPDFPAPAYVLAMGRIWLAEDVEEWIAEHRPMA